MECTCGGRRLHDATCALVVARVPDSLSTIRAMMLKDDAETFYYIVRNDEVCARTYNEFKRKNTGEEYLFSIEAGSVHSMTFINGSEVTFLPAANAGELAQFGHCKKIFLETFDGWEQYRDLLSPITDNITIIDETTKNFL